MDAAMTHTEDTDAVAVASPLETTDTTSAPSAPAHDLSVENEYERRRRENIAANALVLAELGLDSSSTRVKREREPAPRRDRGEAVQLTKSRTSLRAAGVNPDAPPEEAEAAIGNAALRFVPTSLRAGPSSAPRTATPHLDEEQRSFLVAASGWLAHMREHLSARVSKANLDLTMGRVEELASGAGVYLNGCPVIAFEGRAISISDDLVALRTEAKAFGQYDLGGWRLNHPLGKMIQFQEVSAPDAHSA